MADTSNLSQFLTDVADAIRTKKGTTEPIPAESFDTEIESISGGSGEVPVKLFETEEEMQADQNAKEGDLALVYRSEIQNATADSRFSSAMFPNTVVLPTAVTDYIDIMYRATDNSIMFNCWGQLDSSTFNMDCYTETGSIRIMYESTDGITYTRTDGGEEVIDFGTEIYYPHADYWNDAIGYFIQTGGSTFEGLFKYTDSYVNKYYLQPFGIDNLTFDWDGTSISNAAVSQIENSYYIPDLVNLVASLGFPYETKNRDLLFIVDTDNKLHFLDMCVDQFYGYVQFVCVFDENKSFIGFASQYETNVGIYDITDDLSSATLQSTITPGDTLADNTTLRLLTLPFVPKTIATRIRYSEDENYETGCYVNNTVYVQKTDGTLTSNGFSGSDNIYLIESRYITAPTQLTLSTSDQLLPGMIAYGKNGLVTGSNDIYSNLDSSKMLDNLIPEKSTSFEFVSDIYDDKAHYVKLDNLGDNTLIKTVNITNVNFSKPVMINNAGTRLFTVDDTQAIGKFYDATTNEVLKEVSLVGSYSAGTFSKYRLIFEYDENIYYTDATYNLHCTNLNTLEDTLLAETPKLNNDTNVSSRLHVLGKIAGKYAIYSCTKFDKSTKQVLLFAKIIDLATNTAYDFLNVTISAHSMQSGAPDIRIYPSINNDIVWVDYHYRPTGNGVFCCNMFKFDLTTMSSTGASIWQRTSNPSDLSYDINSLWAIPYENGFLAQWDSSSSTPTYYNVVNKTSTTSGYSIVDQDGNTIKASSLLNYGGQLWQRYNPGGAILKYYRIEDISISGTTITMTKSSAYNLTVYRQNGDSKEEMLYLSDLEYDETNDLVRAKPILSSRVSNTPSEIYRVSESTVNDYDYVIVGRAPNIFANPMILSSIDYENLGTISPTEYNEINATAEDVLGGVE